VAGEGIWIEMQGVGSFDCGIAKTMSALRIME
jgi:hypothetical protein